MENVLLYNMIIVDEKNSRPDEHNCLVARYKYTRTCCRSTCKQFSCEVHTIQDRPISPVSIFDENGDDPMAPVQRRTDIFWSPSYNTECRDCKEKRLETKVLMKAPLLLFLILGTSINNLEVDSTVSHGGVGYSLAAVGWL